MLGAVTRPPAHVACVTAGLASVAGVHVTWANVTSYVAVVGDLRVQPVGQLSRPADTCRVERRRHRHVWPAVYGPGGRRCS